jgi:hypothetical protein
MGRVVGGGPGSGCRGGEVHWHHRRWWVVQGDRNQDVGGAVIDRGLHDLGELGRRAMNEVDFF